MCFQKRDQGSTFPLSLLSSASCSPASPRDVFISNAALAIFMIYSVLREVIQSSHLPSSSSKTPLKNYSRLIEELSLRLLDPSKIWELAYHCHSPSPVRYKLVTSESSPRAFIFSCCGCLVNSSNISSPSIYLLLSTSWMKVGFWL